MNSWENKKWNGWGFTGIEYRLNSSTRRFVKRELGKGKPLPDATLEQVISKVPPSRLDSHPLISTDPEIRVRHACGQSIPDWIAMRSGNFLAFPDGVAFPETSSQVRELLDWAQKNRVTLIPYGGGTSVVGHVTVYPQTTPVLTLSLERMKTLISFDKTSRFARFGAGITGREIEEKLKGLGFKLGHYPQSFELSTVGGWIATRSKGQMSLRYGGIEEMFAGGRVETFKGTLEIPTFPGSAAGIDLKEMILGSEGRLGIITEAVVKVHPIEDEEVVGCFFPSWEKGVEAVRQLVQSDHALSMLRLSNAKETEAQLKMSGRAWVVNLYLRCRGLSRGKCFLLIGSPDKEALKKLDGVVIGKSVGEKWKKSRFLVPYLRESLWEEGYVVDTLETACTWEKVDAMVSGIEKALEGAYAFTHLSHVYPQGSSIYTTFLFRQGASHAETLKEWKKLKTAASEAIVSLGGTISHQHGVGVDHQPYLAAEKGEIGIGAIAALAEYFDPHHLLNPGKLVK